MSEMEMRNDTQRHEDSPFDRTDSVVDDADSDDGADEDGTVETSVEHASRAQSAAFHKWAIKQAASELKRRQRGPRDVTHEQFASVSDIIGQQEAAQIIESPRQYQQELFERAKSENTIAVLDTGTGKTLIAVLLLRNVIDQELEDRLAGRAHRIAFFLVPSVNLVFQQHAVLESNLDHEIGRVYGAMRVDLWNKDRWAAFFNQHKVLVCTAEILHKCLGHGFIRMDQINMLIFDEAHHAKLQHPYSKIMRDYYAPLDNNLCPRIFGMTASPVDIKSEGQEILDNAQDLENTLFSKIATAKDLAALQSKFHKPQEKEVPYARLPQPHQSPLTNEVLFKYGHLGFTRGLADRAAIINAHLGQWCADAFWRIALAEKIAGKSDHRLERLVQSGQDGTHESQEDRRLAEAKELVNFISSTAVGQATKEAGIVSSKVLALINLLRDFFGRENDCLCIVFVEQRYTARLLALLFKSLKEGYIRAGALIGTSPTDYLSGGTSFRDQVLTLLRFRKGELNCLFATSVAEEGLDIPACNLIVRFDPCKTMIQYVQSRGRARHRNSTFIHMTEMGNPDHRIMIEDNFKAELLMRRFCHALPEDRLLIGDGDLDGIAADANIKPYEVEETGAKLTASNCVPILSQFCSSLPGEDGEPLRPIYVVQAVTGGFVCEIVMPTCSPIRGQMGKIKRRKAYAKCSAAFQVCAELLRQGFLDKNMLPIYEKRAKLMANAKLAANMYGQKTGLVMRNKPQFWAQNMADKVTRLYGTVIDFQHGLQRPHQPLLLLSRNQMPELPSFPLFVSPDAETTVKLVSLSNHLVVDDAMLGKLTSFTLMMFDDVFSKKYQPDAYAMSYWIAPAVPSDHGIRDLGALIDHASVDRAICEEGPQWHPEMSSEQLVDQYLIDVWHGGKRYFSKAILPSVKAMDPNPMPATVKENGLSVIETTVSLFKRSRAGAVWNPHQPVLKAEAATLRRDFLAPHDGSERVDRCICPEPLRISKLSTAFVASAYLLPSVIHRIESYLVALECCASLNLDLPAGLALEAITKDSNATEDLYGDETKIEFQRGMGNNYERLELFGDTFLKMTTTIAVYIKNAADSEYDFHVKRMLQICNQNLYEVSVEKDLPQFIRNKAMSRRNWYPAGLKMLQGRGINEANKAPQPESLGKKTIADVSEALIGAALFACNKTGRWNPQSWSMAIRAVTELVESDVHDMREWSDYKAAYHVPKWQLLQPRAVDLDIVGKIARERGYEFKNARLLRAVFTHPSIPAGQEQGKSYEQLEFLGDALIDMVSVSHLFYRFPDKDPGWLTEHKMAMISNKFFAAICVKLGFHRHLRHDSSALGKQVIAYRHELEEAERSSGGAKDFWTTVKDPPKALADVVEAYVGALFLDSDFDYNEVQRFFDDNLLPYFGNMDIYDTYTSGHPVTKLHKLLQMSYGCRRFKLLVEEMPTNDDGTDRAVAGVIIHDTVIGGDMGQSSRYAKIRAASKAYHELEGMALSAFRARFRCDCTLSETIDEDTMMTANDDETMRS